MAKEEPNEEYNTQLNVNVPEKLYEEAHIGAFRLGVKLQIWCAKAYRFLLYFQENINMKETVKLANEYYPIICLKIAKNDLAKQGHDVSGLNAEIAKAEAFLQK